MIKIIGSKTRIFLKRFLNKTSPLIIKKILECKYKKEILLAANEAKNDVELFFQNADALFNYVEIETLNRCNGACSFCHINKNIDPRPFARMSDDAFKKIIDNLAELNYCGVIYYHSNNEPFMDSRIIDFIEYGSSKVLNANHRLYTNGTLLDGKKFQSIIESGLNYLRINNYNDNLKLNPNIQKIYNEYKNKEFSMNCEIRLRLKNEILSTRGGSSPNKKIKEPLNASCYFPFSYFVIRANCGVSLCCNDALGKITLGSVEEQTLEEIWFGKKHFDLLKSIRKNMRNDIEICRECDMIPAKDHCITWGISPEFFNRIIK